MRAKEVFPLLQNHRREAAVLNLGNGSHLAAVWNVFESKAPHFSMGAPAHAIRALSPATDVVARQPDAPAIIEDGRTLTFGELSAMVDMIADSFPDGTRAVGVVMRHRAEMVASMLAALKAGATYVPAEPGFPTGRIRFMMEEAKVDFVLTEMQFSARLEGFEQVYSDCSICTAAPGSALRAYIQSPGAVAYVLYTSGTTGRPKGVQVTNRNVCHYVRAFASEFHPGLGDIMLQHSVCSFDIFVEEVFASLLNGAALAIPRR